MAYCLTALLTVLLTYSLIYCLTVFMTYQAFLLTLIDCLTVLLCVLPSYYWVLGSMGFLEAGESIKVGSWYWWRKPTTDLLLV